MRGVTVSALQETQNSRKGSVITPFSGLHINESKVLVCISGFTPPQILLCNCVEGTNPRQFIGLHARVGTVRHSLRSGTGIVGSEKRTDESASREYAG